ncbi:hypothetical protein ACFOPN_00005 [Xanthomonas hyacinthi]|uniref:hypothetical protein n=1 Tax=Xanthomonas hyacinthi TaxID=56455 RepID=UPI00361561D6
MANRIAIDRRPRAATLAVLWLLLTALVVLAFTARQSVPLLTTIVAVAWGFAYSAMPMLFQSAMLRAAPRSPDPASAILFTSVNVAITAGSFLGGKMLDAIGVAWIPLLACACVVGAIGTVSAARRHAFPVDHQARTEAARP